jgi:hypothetical protein
MSATRLEVSCDETEAECGFAYRFAARSAANCVTSDAAGGVDPAWSR